MNQNRSKYFKYAIGEIVLVVVGILIALSISNLNEKRKDKVFEHNILAEINQNLELDSIALTDIHIVYLKARMSYEKIISTKNETVIQDSLQWWLADVAQFERFRPISSAFEVLKSKNLGMVSDQTLRLDITTYYDNHVKWMIQSLEDVELAFKNEWIPEFNSEFIEFKFKQYATPRSPVKWVSMENNIIFMSIFNDNREGVFVPLEEGLLLISKIRAAINSELKH
jgi:Family of unknown function (DUF6090)